MSKVTYILGAGASCGNWSINDNSIAKRGVPTINRFVDALEFLINDIKAVIDDKYDLVNADLTKEEGTVLLDSFSFLKEKCQEYPTIDTYAKQVFVSHSADNPLAKSYQLTDYEFVVRAVSAFLLLIQDIKRRDSRYDGFIASVINEQGEFPSMTILSWNYDAQFEMAYSGYIPDYKQVVRQWQILNAYNKTYFNPKHDVNKLFGLVKLNGTAFFTDKSRIIQSENGLRYELLIDNYFDYDINKKYKIASHLISSRNTYTPTLSYVWDKSKMKEDMMSVVKNRCHDTEELIVIGYSFPYVNRDVDSQIISSMPLLKKVCIQDPNSKDIRERIKSILVERLNSVEIYQDENLSQFHIPNGF